MIDPGDSLHVAAPAEELLGAPGSQVLHDGSVHLQEHCREQELLRFLMLAWLETGRHPYARSEAEEARDTHGVRGKMMKRMEDPTEAK